MIVPAQQRVYIHKLYQSEIIKYYPTVLSFKTEQQSGLNY